MSTTLQPAVHLSGVDKYYGDAQVVRQLDLSVRKGEFLTLLGPSGCGKTTTLRMVAGFVKPTAGRIDIGGVDVTHTEPRHRRIGMVFQDYALFPHLTVSENIAFGLVERGARSPQIAARVSELLDLIQLPELGGRYPSQLSGGQQQRVALARAIAHPPEVLLLDEPLGALDLKMREHMQLEVRRIQQHLQLTAIYVTHDQTEAMTMSDRVAVMNAGQLEQIDTPEAIYNRPCSRYVANFIGKVNFLDGHVTSVHDGIAHIEGPAGHCLCLANGCRPGDRVTVCVRPEHLTLHALTSPPEAMHHHPAQVLSSVFCGSIRQYQLRLASGQTLLSEVRAGDRAWPIGDTVLLSWEPQHAVLVPNTPIPINHGESP